MILPTNFRKLSLTEKQNFTDEILPAVKTSLGENALFKPYIAQVEADLSHLKVSSQVLTHPELTAEIVDGDELRDGGISSLKQAATRAAGRRDPVWVKAGQCILNAFHDIGDNIAALPINKETSSIENLLGVIESTPDLKQAITTIHAEVWLQDIKDGQQIVKDVIKKRDTSKIENDSASDKARQLTVSVDKLLRYINSKIEFEPAPEFTALALELNKIIDRYRKTVKLRATLHSKGSQSRLDKD